MQVLPRQLFAHAMIPGRAEMWKRRLQHNPDLVEEVRLIIHIRDLVYLGIAIEGALTAVALSSARHVEQDACALGLFVTAIFVGIAAASLYEATAVLASKL